MQQITVLGATGSIGSSTLDVVARHPDRYRLFALTAHRRIDELAALCLRFAPRHAVVERDADAERLARLLAGRVDTTVHAGEAALVEVAAHPDVDTVMAAIVGAAGLAPTLAAARAGKRVLLANKESLVLAGRWLMDAVREHGATLLPIDSEHNAVFQSLPGNFAQNPQVCGVHKVVLTASGGPFRTTPLERLQKVTPDEACAHPNWSMGRKISVDSATMMNKGLEVIEAHWLFAVPPEAIEVVIHPQSVIHSMVQYIDGSMLAQLGNPDMRTPIAHALAYPERIEAGVAPLDLVAVSQLHFERPDLERFPCLALAFESLRAGGAASAVLNAANEVAVASFLDQQIGFCDIARINAECLAQLGSHAAATLDDVLAADQAARQHAARLIAQGSAA